MCAVLPIPTVVDQTRMLAGSPVLLGIAEWAYDLPWSERRGLGLGRRPPSESTSRRLLHRVDPYELDRAVAAGSPAQPSPLAQAGQPAQRMVAVDGNAVRGAQLDPAATGGPADLLQRGFPAAAPGHQWSPFPNLKLAYKG